MTAFNRSLQSTGAYLYWGTSSLHGFAALNEEVTRQAAIIAYVNDFKLLFVVSMLMLPLLLMLRRPVGAAPATDATRIAH